MSPWRLRGVGEITWCFVGGDQSNRPALRMTTAERNALQRMAASTSLPHWTVVQARALLWAGDGVSNQEIARRSGVDSDAVRRWRARFGQKRVDGVGVIAKGRGRQPSLPAATVAEVLRITQHERPADGSTHWTTRTLVAKLGIGRTRSPASGATTT